MMHTAIAKVTLKRRALDDDGEYQYYCDTPEGRVGVIPDHGEGERVEGWITFLVDNGSGTSHRTLADVRAWIARGGR